MIRQEKKRYSSLQEFIDDIKGKSEKEEDIKKTLEDTLTRAYDIRKVELDLYWKRATYFWGFLIAAFTAYFIVMNEYYDFAPSDKFLVICVGFVFSYAWYLVNRGSTYWLTNWERIIDAIEEHLGMNLYKVNLQEKIDPKFSENHPYSVSRINIIVSYFICIIWAMLIIFFIVKNIYDYCISDKHSSCPIMDIDVKIISFFLITVIMTIYIGDTKSGKGDDYSFYQRYSELKP
jgi:hypothetical protein